MRFSSQGKPLLHAEAVLLVDDRERETREGDLLLKQSMRADGDHRLRTLQLLRDCLPLRRRESSVQPSDRYPERTKPVGELAHVLLGEDLGGRHHRRLAAGIDRGEAGDRGDDGFAAADVALQQPLHRMRLREVAQDLRHGAALRARQSKRQLAEKAL